ncbi:MAG: two pore domain potassium channel family protein [Planctomycetes bacterium]|nr:two pore domain potassium channel family protein [Planctomycetota bacterium]
MSQTPGGSNGGAGLPPAAAKAAANSSGQTPRGIRHVARRHFKIATELMQPGMRKHSVALFLGALVTLVICTPVFEQFSWGEIGISIAVSFVLCSGVLAIGAKRRTLVLAITLMVPALILRWANHTHPHQMPPILFVFGAMVFMTFVTVNLVQFIVRAPRVNSEVLSAGIAVYLIFGLVWSLAYTMVAELQPNAFAFSNPTPEGMPPPTMQGVTSLYFSFITLNTVGYGDIVPISPFARMLAMLESTTGLFYMALMVARLVSLYTSEATEARAAQSQ